MLSPCQEFLPCPNFCLVGPVTFMFSKPIPYFLNASVLADVISGVRRGNEIGYSLVVTATDAGFRVPAECTSATKTCQFVHCGSQLDIVCDFKDLSPLTLNLHSAYTCRY